METLTCTWDNYGSNCLQKLNVDWRLPVAQIWGLCGLLEFAHLCTTVIPKRTETYFCWSFMVSMIVRSSLTCVLSSSKDASPWLEWSVFGFPSVLNKDGEFDRWPIVPTEPEWSADVDEDDNEDGMLLPLVKLPGLAGNEALLSDTY